MFPPCGSCHCYSSLIMLHRNSPILGLPLPLHHELPEDGGWSNPSLHPHCSVPDT